jgi:hypothetical protein
MINFLISLTKQIHLMYSVDKDYCTKLITFKPKCLILLITIALN